MNPSFRARLINDPFSDPGLFVTLLFQRRAFLFDIGELQRLSARDLLKVSHVFVSHAHVDHFIGFDHLLRLTLGRDKMIHFFGPPGFFGHVEGKLAGYVWNLVGEYPKESMLKVSEVHPESIRTKVYVCRERYQARGGVEEIPFTGTLLHEPSFQVDTAIFDHRIPCLGFTLKEDFQVRIMKDKLEEMGLPVGPWLTRFKKAMAEEEDLTKPFHVTWQEHGDEGREREFALGELAEKIALVAPGMKVTYITDLIGTPENIQKAVNLAKGSDKLFIEAGFLYRDREKALEKYHLTARQAGEVAGLARVKEFTLFHHSPRYEGLERELRQEAEEAFAKASSLEKK